MVVNKDFKKSKTNRLELDDIQNTNISDSSFKMIFSDDTLLYYRNAIDMSLLADTLNHVLYEIKELLTITKIYITIINILIFIVSIGIFIITIIIIITINVITISINTAFVKSAWQIC